MSAQIEIPSLPLEERYKYVIWDHKMAMEVIRMKLYQKDLDPTLIEDIYEDVYSEGGPGFVETWKEKLGLGDDPGSCAILAYVGTEVWNFEGRELIEANENRGHVILTTRDPAWEAIKTLDMEKKFSNENISLAWIEAYGKAFNPKLKITINFDHNFGDPPGCRIEVIIERE